jgi:hypothetical protein
MVTLVRCSTIETQPIDHSLGNGVLANEIGTVNFVQAQLVVKIDYNFLDYVTKAATDIHGTMGNILRTLTTVSLSTRHQTTILDQITNTGIAFKLLIQRIGRRALRQLGYLTIRGLEQDLKDKWVRAKIGLRDNTRRGTNTTTRPDQPNPSEIVKSNLTSSSNVTKPKTTHLERQKRGFFDLGGKLVKSVLGLATEDDLSALRDSFKDINQGVVTSLKKLELQFHRLQETLVVLLDQATDALEEIEELHHEVEELNLFMLLLNTVNNIREGIDFITLLTIDGQIKIAQLRLGHVPPVIGFEDLDELVKEGREHFRDLCIFPYIYTENNVTDVIYKLGVRTLSEDNFAIILPFVSRTSMSLIELQNFPIVDPTSNTTALITNLPPYVAIADDSKLFSEGIELSQCDQTARAYVCPPPVQISSENPSCAIQSLQGVAQTQCILQEVNITNVLVRKLGQTSFLYVPKPEWGVLSCSENNSAPQHVLLEGAYILHPPCSISAPTFTLSSIKHAYIAQKSKQLEAIPFTNFSIPHERLIPHVKVLLSEIKQVRDHLNNTIEVLTVTTNVRHYATISALPALVVILMIMMLGYHNRNTLGHLCKNKVGKPSPNPMLSPSRFVSIADVVSRREWESDARRLSRGRGDQLPTKGDAPAVTNTRSTDSRPAEPCEGNDRAHQTSYPNALPSTHREPGESAAEAREPLYADVKGPKEDSLTFTATL